MRNLIQLEEISVFFEPHDHPHDSIPHRPAEQVPGTIAKQKVGACISEEANQESSYRTEKIPCQADQYDLGTKVGIGDPRKMNLQEPVQQDQ